MDDQAEIQYFKAGLTEGYGNVAYLEMKKSLRLPANTNKWAVIVPSYWLNKGVKLPAFPFATHLTNGVPVKIACKWNRDKSWMVLNEVLPDELWSRYEEQIRVGQGGVVLAPLPESIHIVQEQNQEIQAALEKIGEYGKQLDNGTLTWEEFQRLTDPLEQIVHQPTTFEIE